MSNFYKAIFKTLLMWPLIILFFSAAVSHQLLHEIEWQWAFGNVGWWYLGVFGGVIWGLVGYRYKFKVWPWSDKDLR